MMKVESNMIIVAGAKFSRVDRTKATFNYIVDGEQQNSFTFSTSLLLSTTKVTVYINLATNNNILTSSLDFFFTNLQRNTTRARPYVT